MSATPSILAFAGSLRAGSFNKKLVGNAAAGARAAGAEVTEIDLRDYQMPVYDGDLEAAEGLPERVTELKRLFIEHDGLLISCPEYNSSISAVLKNTIDWLSRPNGDEPPLACFAGKVAVIMSASPGALGGLRGLVTVRSILGNIRVIMLPDQHAVGHAHDAFDADGRLEDDATRAKVEGLGATLAQTIARMKR